MSLVNEVTREDIELSFYRRGSKYFDRNWTYRIADYQGEEFEKRRLAQLSVSAAMVRYLIPRVVKYDEFEISDEDFAREIGHAEY